MSLSRTQAGNGASVRWNRSVDYQVSVRAVRTRHGRKASNMEHEDLTATRRSIRLIRDSNRGFDGSVLVAMFVILMLAMVVVACIRTVSGF